MRALAIHETVMQLMINTLNKAQQQSAETETETQKKISSSMSVLPTESVAAEPPKVTLKLFKL